MKRAFRIIKISVLILGALFILTGLVATGWMYYNHDKIYTAAISEVNETHTGLLKIEDVDISPFENFPYISIGLHKIDLFEDKSETAVRIAHVDDAYVGFDIWDIIRGEYVIRKIKIKDGYARLELDENGDLNLKKALSGKQPVEEAPSEEPVYLDLQAVEVVNFRIEEFNEQGNKYINVVMQDVDAVFSNLSEFVRVTFKGDLELTEYTADNVTYFKDKPFALDTRFTYDLIGEMLTIFPGQLILEYGLLDFEGSVDFANELFLDLEFSGQKENFDVFISFAPNEVAETLNKFRNEGDIFFKGSIFGRSVNANPAIDLELGCENTFFFHKDESKAVKNLAFSGRFHTGADNSLETSEFVLTNLYGIPETGEFKGTFRVVNFINPIVSVDFHADLDLKNFQSFYDPEWLEDAEGKVKIDITINEFVDQDSVIHIASKMEDGTLSRIEFYDASVKLASYRHRLENLAGKVVLDGDNLLLEKLSCKVDESDLLMTASLGHLNAIAHKQSAIVDFTLHLESEKIDIASLLPPEMSRGEDAWKTEVITDLFADFDLNTTVDDINNYRYIPKAKLDIRGFRGKLEGFNQPLHKVAGTITTSDDQIFVDDLTAVVGRNDLHLHLLIDDPGLFLEKGAKGASHMHATIVSDRFDFKDFLFYRGEALVDTAIQAELGDERIRDLHFECDGLVHPSTFSPHGWLSYCELEELTVRLNDLPKLKNARGKIRTDTTGCLYIEGFSAQLGRSDFYADLQLLHLLDSLGDKREIYGRVGGSLWDFDEYVSTSEPTQSAGAAQGDSVSQAQAHAAKFNIFALPFPELDVELEVGRIVSERYKLGDVMGHFKASPDHMVWIDTLHFRAASGRVGIGGYLNGSVKEDLYLKGRIALENVDIDQLFFKFDNFGQDYLVSEQVHGRIDGSIDVKAHLHPDLTPMLDRTEAHMALKISEGRLENFAPMQAMSDFIGDRNLNNIRFGEMENTFDFKDGTLDVPKMKIASTLGYIFLSGQQDMQDHINYEVQVPLSLVQSAGWNMLRNKVKGGDRNSKAEDLAESDEEIISEQTGLIRRYMTFNISGTTEEFEVGMGKKKKDLP